MDLTGAHHPKKIRRPVPVSNFRGIFSRSRKMRIFPRLKRRVAIVAVLLAVVFGLGSAGLVFWRAQRALRQASADMQAQASEPFSVRRLSVVNSDFEWISAPNSFSGAAFFNGDFYLAAASGLFRYDNHGALIRHYRPGQELPPAPLLRLATSVLKDAKEPELLMVTPADGVLAFDGSGFRQILPERAETRSITSILPLRTGDLLIGTRKRGVLVYDGQKLRAFHPTLTALHVTELAGSESDLWIGTQDQGVVHWQAGRAETFTEAEGMPDQQVFSIALADDKAYVGTAVGIAEFEAGRFVRVLAPGLFTRALWADGPALFAGGSGEGITEINLQPQRMPNLMHASARGISDVQQIFSQGELLYAVTSGALYRREGQRGGWRRVLSVEQPLLADRNISALALDERNRLWVGYFDHGLDFVDPGLRSAAHYEDDNVFCVNRILPNGANGMVAVATANGLVLFDQLGRKQQVLGRADGLLADHITDAALYGKGMVLATPAGLTFLDNSGPRSLYAFHGLVNNHVYSVATAGKEVVAGTLGGISVLENENVAANYTVATRGLSHNWISGIVRNGNDWVIGTYGGGIVRLMADGRFEPFDVATAKFEVYPNAMLATGQHILAGTLGRGLYVYNRASNHWSVVTAGLPSLTVTALTAGNGVIYVGTDNGLVRIPEQNLP
jgi:ligand-binding sensor domain-containing protein